jgi:hypothetical protein
MYASSFRRVLLTTCAFTALLFLAARPAAAQSFGPRVGVSVDPDQFVFGGHYETKPLVEHITFRPNIEIGVGNDLTVTCFNFELTYHFPDSHSWNVYAGGGPALVLVNQGHHTDSGGGFNLLVGIQAHEGLFGEVKAGMIDSPNFKFTIGYMFHF